MRYSLSLVAALLLLGAGCSSETKLNPEPTNPPVTANPVSDSAGGTYEAGSPEANKPDTEGTACTMDAKACPDGSYVGRVAPNCEFAACPTTKPTETKPVEQAVKPVETKPVEVKPTEPTGPKSYTLAEVQAQAAAGKCWTIISGKVYDLSAWISKHPGGESAIKSLCGINGTAKFMAMHGGAAKPEAVLANYYIGVAK